MRNIQFLTALEENFSFAPLLLPWDPFYTAISQANSKYIYKLVPANLVQTPTFSSDDILLHLKFLKKYICIYNIKVLTGCW